MAKKKSVWEVYLRPNILTKDNDRDCIADVHSRAATQRNEDIADIITKERTEFRKETIISILNMRDKAVKDLLKDVAQGVFFRLANGTEHKVTRRLSVNQPSQIIARVPKEVRLR